MLASASLPLVPRLEMAPPLNRRSFLRLTLAGAALAALPGGVARALGPGQQLRLLRLRHGGLDATREGAPSVLAEEVGLRTSVDILPAASVVDPASPQFGHQAFAILAGDRDFRLDPREHEALKRWLELGGFLLIDNTGASGPSAAFDAAVRRELGKLFPNRPLRRVSADHVIYRSFYRLDYPAGRAIHKPYVEGLKIGDRYAVILSHNDLMGAYARGNMGDWSLRPTPGGENQREMALRFGTNLVMYGLCLHYKDDQVHLDYLLHKRKWKVRRPVE